MEVFDKGAVAISISSLAIYHIYTYSSVFCLHNENIQLSRNLSNSFFWIQKHRAYADAASTTLAGMLYYLMSTSAQWTSTLHTVNDTNDCVTFCNAQFTNHLNTAKLKSPNDMISILINHLYSSYIEEYDTGLYLCGWICLPIWLSISQYTCSLDERSSTSSDSFNSSIFKLSLLG